MFFPPTENVTSSSTAISLAATFSLPLLSAARTVPTPLTPSSFYLLPPTSTHNVGKSTSSQSKGTVKTSGFSANRVSSTALTSSVSGHGVTRNKLPHLSALMTTSTGHSVAMDTAPVLTTTWATACVSGASESSLVSRNTLHGLPSRLTTSSESEELERIETARVTMSTSLSQLSSSPSAPSPRISAPTDQPTEMDKMTFSSLRLYITSGRQTSLSQLSSPSSASSSQLDVPTLILTSTIVLPCTTHEEIITKPTETKEELTPSTSRQRQTFLSISSLQTMASTLMSTSSVELRCATNEGVAAPPTAQPEETSSIPGILVQFQPAKSDQELVRTQRATSRQTFLQYQIRIIILNIWRKQYVNACNN